MKNAIQDWVATGHPLLYASSMQVLTAGTSVYARHKQEIEEFLCGIPKCAVVRFGTVYGGLDQDPARPHTVPNRIICSKGKWRPDEGYRAYWTPLWSAVHKLVAQVDRFQRWAGTVENITQPGTPRTNRCIEPFIARMNVSLDFPPSDERIEELKNLPHPTRLLAEKVGLPYED